MKTLTVIILGIISMAVYAQRINESFTPGDIGGDDTTFVYNTRQVSQLRGESGSFHIQFDSLDCAASAIEIRASNNDTIGKLLIDVDGNPTSYTLDFAAEKEANKGESGGYKGMMIPWISSFPFKYLHIVYIKSTCSGSGVIDINGRIR